MRWPRMTIRTLMGAVLSIGFFLGLGLPAAEVYNDRRGHSHVYVVPTAEGPRLESEDGMTTPFWPTYWLRLNGKPWRRQPICGSGRGRIEETCEIADINILFRACFSSYKRPRPSDAMRTKFPELKRW